MEEDEAGRLAGFRARFGRGFDVERESAAPMEAVDNTAEKGSAAVEKEKVENVGLEDNGFAEEEDANLLELISSFGQESGSRSHKKGSGKGK